MVKSLIAFSQLVLQDLGDRCRVCTDRDSKTITTRVEEEGEAFLTLTLPAFGKSFLTALDNGYISSDSFPGFASSRVGLPRFLSGFLEQIFDGTTGVVLLHPSRDAIFAVHELCSLFGKMKEQASNKRTARALVGWMECEQDVRARADSLSESDLSDFHRVSRVLFQRTFNSLNERVVAGDLIPKHGPGATAERLSANAKYSQLVWTSRLEEWFPAGEYLFPNWGWYNHLQATNILEPGEEMPVRVITVPKTQKTPRIIAIEPSYVQYVQQGILEALIGELQGDNLLWSLIGWLDQVPNRTLAQEGSLLGNLATLDLSEASDRVSWRVVQRMLSDHPQLLGAVDACRSRTADVPGHGVTPLAKFASMGSALCFPFEAMVFMTLVALGWERANGKRFTRHTLQDMLGCVRVYGDDIIIPVDMTRSVIDSLESFGMKVNQNKSFWTGRFRESCGGDYYAGWTVTPVKVRRRFPTSRKHVEEIVSTVSLRNQLFELGGFGRTVRYLDDLVGSLLPMYPEVPRHSPALGRWSHSPVNPDRSHPSLHKPVIKACVVRSVIPRDPLGDHGALMKWFLKRSDLPFAAKDHLQRAGRPESVDIKTRWVALDERVTESGF